MPMLNLNHGKKTVSSKPFSLSSARVEPILDIGESFSTHTNRDLKDLLQSESELNQDQAFRTAGTNDVNGGAATPSSPVKSSTVENLSIPVRQQRNIQRYN